MEYYLIGYAENIRGSIMCDHRNEVIDYSPEEFILQCLELKDRSIALTMIHKIDEATFKRLERVLG